MRSDFQRFWPNFPLFLHSLYGRRDTAKANSSISLKQRLIIAHTHALSRARRCVRQLRVLFFLPSEVGEVWKTAPGPNVISLDYNMEHAEGKV